MIFKGVARKFRENVNTDEIIPARYLNTTDPDELAKHCMEDIHAEFVKNIKPGDMIVAGKNFGCGSSREHAPISIKASGISCVIAESFARIFFRNSINIGLPIFESRQAARDIKAKDLVEVDTDKGEIRNLTTGVTYKSQKFPPFMQGLVEAGGLMNWVKRQALKKK